LYAVIAVPPLIVVGTSVIVIVSLSPDVDIKLGLKWIYLSTGVVNVNFKLAPDAILALCEA
jgi:hypothetical protein